MGETEGWWTGGEGIEDKRGTGRTICANILLRAKAATPNLFLNRIQAPSKEECSVKQVCLHSA